MKAALLVSPGKFETRILPDPKLVNVTDVLVRIKTVGVCGSDIHYYTTGRIGSQVVKYPFIVGHEAGGVVEKTGKRVTRVKPGDKVAIDPAVSCGSCDQCKSGREHTCRHLHFLGAPGQLAGAQCEFIVMPERNCFPIAEGMTYEQAALSEPLAIAVYAVKKSPVGAKNNLAIVGMGPIGMSVFHVIRTKSTGSIYVTDKIEERLRYSERLNPNWSGNPLREDVVKEISRAEPLQLDVVYECSGDPAALRQGVDLLKPGGTLVIVGIPEVDEITLPVHELRRKEITIVNVRRQRNTTQEALDLLASGRVRMDSMVTHRFPLEDAQAAFETVSRYIDGVMKAMIVVD